MASDKNLVFVLTNCKGSDLLSADSTNIAQIKTKGVVVSNVRSNDFKLDAAKAGTEENFWDKARNEGLVVGSLNEQYDICVFENIADVASLESELTTILEKIERKTLLIVIADSAIIYYGNSVAKGKVVDDEKNMSSVVPTAAYIVNLPMPECCNAPITFEVLKDINMKFKYERKLQSTIVNMEAAIEKHSRKPWDKHDCA